MTEVNRAKGSELVPWPQRLIAPPPRLEELGVTSDKYLEDTVSHRMNIITAMSICPFNKYQFLVSCSLSTFNAGGLALESDTVLEADEI